MTRTLTPQHDGGAPFPHLGKGAPVTDLTKGAPKPLTTPRALSPPSRRHIYPQPLQEHSSPQHASAINTNPARVSLTTLRPAPTWDEGISVNGAPIPNTLLSLTALGTLLSPTRMRCFHPGPPQPSPEWLRPQGRCTRPYPHPQLTHLSNTIEGTHLPEHTICLHK